MRWLGHMLNVVACFPNECHDVLNSPSGPEAYRVCAHQMSDSLLLIFPAYEVTAYEAFRQEISRALAASEVLP